MIFICNERSLLQIKKSFEQYADSATGSHRSVMTSVLVTAEETK